MNDFSIWEILFLACFAVSWPISITKSLRTHVVIGKSPLFMMIIILGYIFGIIHKFTHNPDFVTALYFFNATLVSFDLFLYFKYVEKNKLIFNKWSHRLMVRNKYMIRKWKRRR